jgi:hypothetical protein
VIRRILIDLNGPQGARCRSTVCSAQTKQWIGDSLDSRQRSYAIRCRFTMEVSPSASNEGRALCGRLSDATAVKTRTCTQVSLHLGTAVRQTGKIHFLLLTCDTVSSYTQSLEAGNTVGWRGNKRTGKAHRRRRVHRAGRMSCSEECGAGLGQQAGLGAEPRSGGCTLWNSLSPGYC